MDQPTQPSLAQRLAAIALPDAARIQPGVTNWPKVKAITSLMAGAVVGGAAGFAAYGLPYVFLAALYTGGPLLAVAGLAKTVQWLLPEGSASKTAMRGLARKCARLGGVCAFYPVLLAGGVAMGVTHTALTVLASPATLLARRAKSETVTGNDVVAYAPSEPAAPRFARLRHAGQSFREVAIRVYRGEPAPMPARDPQP